MFGVLKASSGAAASDGQSDQRYLSGLEYRSQHRQQYLYRHVHSHYLFTSYFYGHLKLRHQKDVASVDCRGDTG